MNKLKCKVCGKERVIIYGRAMKCCDTVQYLPPEPKEEYAECPNCGVVASGGIVTWIKEPGPLPIVQTSGAPGSEGYASGPFPKYGKSIIDWIRELEEKENEENKQD